MDTIGTLTSLSLQYGVPIEAMVNKFAHMRFEPSGWTGNPDIPNAKSVPDYIFRWLGMEFIPGYREANAPKRNGMADNGHGPATRDHGNGHGNGGHGAESNGRSATARPSPTAGAIAGRPSSEAELFGDGPHVRSQQFAKFQADAPACDNCGAITVRNGNCYLCHNCGNSMGCS
jgi:ribonucleoside-diphosphate reductase alpha chain